MKPSSKAARFRFFELSEKARDASLSGPELDEFDSLAAAHPDLLDHLAQSLLIDAELRHDVRLLADLQAGGGSMRSVSSWRPALFIFLATAACVMLGLLLVQNSRRISTPSPVATLVKASGCKWASSSLPTVEGSRVPPGTYELVEGLATLRFDSGAEVVLEAPASLEIVSAMGCRLLHGTLVSDVPPSAIGFIVDTRKARVVDYGTRFGVSASADGEYMVQVLEGLVEVEDHREETKKMLTAGQNMDRGMIKQQVSPPALPAEPNRWQPDTIINDGDGWQVLSTGYGRGKDAFIESSGDGKNFGKEAYFRVKRTTIQPHLNRKGYLAFDLASFRGRGFENAELTLAIEPSDLGFATLVPDSTFLVYGLVDERGDDWGETSISDRNAPGHDPAQLEAHLPSAKAAILLGSFKIAQGVSRGTCTLRSEALVEFLNADTNGIATFILCRDTDETARAGLVHAFATRENGRNTPPLLRLKPKS